MSWLGGLFRRKDPELQRLQGIVRQTHQALLQARFDLAQTTTDNQNHWAAADGLSGRAALNPEVRKRMRERSRLEAENSSWYAGILSTATNHIVGTGPRLQVTTANNEGNSRLEKAWASWASAVNLTEKLRVAVETYWRDGEVFLMRARRPALGVVELDIRLYESEQCHEPTPGGSYGDPYQDDGIRIDPGSNELEYWFADHHPSDPFYTGSIRGRWYQSKNVIHLFRRQRPGQLRGSPRFASGLPYLAVMRRFEMATAHAAEAVANVALYMKTTGSGVTPAESTSEPFTTAPTVRNAMMLLPDGYDLFQPKMENPNSNLEMFIRQGMMYFCRAGNVPLGLGLGTSKDSNFSSFKGDIRNIWGPEVKAEQDRLTTMLVEIVFGWFLEEIVLDTSYVDHTGATVPGVLDGMPPICKIDHQWYWDSLPPMDELDAAAAAEKRIQSGQSTLPQEYADKGVDFDTAMAKGAAGFGISVAAMKTAIFNQLFGIVAGTALPVVADPTQPAIAGGSYTELGQRAFRNNIRRITEMLDQVQSGEMTPLRAAVFMQSIGVDKAHIDALLSDVAVTQKEQSNSDLRTEVAA